MLEVRGLSHGFGPRELLRDLDLRVEAGQRWALLGLNGSGKTTLLHLLAGLTPPQQGVIRLHDQPLAQYNRRALARQVGLLLQKHSDSFPVSVRDTLLAGCHPRTGPWGWPSSEDQRKAEQLLELLELEDLAERQSDSLSGGERQRLAIAQLLLQNPRLALLDEPDSQLDPCRRNCLVDLLADRFSRDGRTCLMSLHDPNLAWRYCSHVLLLFGDGRWQAGRRDDLLDRDHLEQVYGCRVRQLETDAGRVFLPGF